MVWFVTQTAPPSATILYLTMLADDEPPLLKHARVFMIAHQVRINGLQDLALQKFERDLQYTRSADDVAKCASEIYGSQNACSKLLRPVVVERVKACLTQGSSKDCFDDVCQKYASFAVDLITALLPTK